MSRKLVFGVGVNDSDYRVIHVKSFGSEGGKRIRKIIWECPYYKTWTSVMRRSYSEHYKKENPTYVDVNSCGDWIYFSNFKAWMEQQNYEGLHLDKDILVPGNKVYSPETCVFVPQRINTVLLDCGASRGEQPIGVSLKLDRKTPYYIAQVCKDGRGSVHIGCYKNAADAHKAWQWEKAKVIEQTVSWYATQNCFRADVAERLLTKVWTLRLENSKGIETK